MKRHKKVRGEVVAVTRPKDRPTCIVHHMTEMEFSPRRLVWECPVKTCPQIAQPVTDLQGTPTTFDGPFDLIRVVVEGEHDTYLLRTGKTYFDVSDNVQVIRKRDSHGGVRVTMVFDQHIVMDGEGRVIDSG